MVAASSLPAPVPTGRPTRLAPRGRSGGYGGGGLLTAPPAPAGAGPGVALKIHHEAMDKKNPTLGAGGAPATARPAPRCSPAGGTAPHRPASRTGARGCSDLRRRDRETTAGAGGRAAGVTGDTACPWPLGRGWGRPHPPPGRAASRDATRPGPQSCAGRARGNEQGEGPGPCQHRPPTGERPQAAITLWGSPGQPRRERGCAGPCAGAGTESFLPRPCRGVAGVPPRPRSTGHLLRLPPGPAQRSGSGCRRRQTGGTPSSLLPASSASNAEGRSRLRATGSDSHRTKNATEKGNGEGGETYHEKKKR